MVDTEYSGSHQKPERSLETERHHQQTIILSLPDEMLSQIREMLMHLESTGFRSPGDYVPNVSFSLTCRRFRQLELHTPRIWTTISDKMNLERIMLHIERSKNLPLDILLVSIGEEAQKKWTYLVKTSQRWITLAIQLNGLPHMDVFRGLQLPNLDKLFISKAGLRMTKILQTWALPVIRSMHIVLFRPLWLELSRPLNTLRLDISDYQTSASEAFRFLQLDSASYVTHLHLKAIYGPIQIFNGLVGANLHLTRVERLTVQYTGHTGAFKCFLLPLLRQVTFPNIKYVEFRQYSGYIKPEALVQFLSSVYVPQLQKFELYICGALFNNITKAQFQEVLHEVGTREFIAHDHPRLYSKQESGTCMVAEFIAGESSHK